MTDDEFDEISEAIGTEAYAAISHIVDKMISRHNVSKVMSDSIRYDIAGKFMDSCGFKDTNMEHS